MRLAHGLSDLVVTASKEIYPLVDVKVRELGHGVEVFEGPRKEREGLLVCVGRISRVKRIEEAVEALKLLKDRGLAAELLVVGPIYDAGYFNELKGLIEELGVKSLVRFKGAVPHGEISKIYAEASVLVSCCPAFDKAVLEAMAAGVPVVVCDPSFKELLGEYCEYCMYDAGKPGSLAEKLGRLLSSRELRNLLSEELKRRVSEEHGLAALTFRLAEVLYEAASSKASTGGSTRAPAPP